MRTKYIAWVITKIKSNAYSEIQRFQNEKKKQKKKQSFFLNLRKG